MFIARAGVAQAGVFGPEVAEVGLEFTVEVLQRQDLGDSGDVDATGDQGTDALQAHHVVIAVAAGAPPVRAGVSNPRRS
ncbi:hypothetical protein MMAN_16650 [Mycobacterium mantenii]|uniref:Uncharacterized protein n=1 Tax=Mycobacterium mantenii TaxID=560555 RepID=A0ABM7JPQ9_MYCNT|nr:hypothetical protein MMAN_16650 [Mycobacterium mantenii]BBZ52225.1 hypothetical protein MHEI_39420 [Mycobacterium heidelbergense]